MAFCPNNDGRWALGVGRWALGVGRWALGGLKTKFENFALNFAQQGAGLL